jgi:uncharacterized protein YcnI
MHGSNVRVWFKIVKGRVSMSTFSQRASVKSLAVLGLILVAATAVNAHVRVRPMESKPGSTETYKMTVPTEGKVATVKVELVLPEGVQLVSVDNAKPHSVRKGEAGTSIITWQEEIPPANARDYIFTARNPQTGSEISWYAHQFFADGSEADWVEAPGSKRPASVTKLVSAP